MLEVGSLVDGRYKILSEIGHGGMSNVYMAIHEKANKTWAVKEVRKNGVVDFEAVKTGLMVETNLLKKLKHPNLPTIVDVIENEESFLIVMDYIEGKSLSELLKEYGAIPQKNVIAWAKTLCGVLLYLHAKSPPIIYRDMKPDNIMLKPDGNLMLIDFGTAREFKKHNCSDTICLGTVGYAAPEQFGGMGQTDARTDIYGMGATMYHLLTGYSPAKVSYEKVPIRQINENLSAGLEKIIEKCMQRNPADRYQTAAELMYALEHYEEMDDSYRKRQKMKLISFICLAVLIVMFSVMGHAFHYSAVRTSDHIYQSMLDEAEKTTDYAEKIQFYYQSIEVPDKAAEAEAYLGIVQAYKENDMAFSVQEANQLIKCIKNNKSKLLENVENYIEICFEVGKLYWYYFVEDDGSINQAVRGKYAAEWFEDLIEYTPTDYKNLNMVRVYARIGIFYRDIAMDVIEANDKGKYKLLYEDIKTLLHQVALDEGESEIVRLELLEFSRNAIWQYASKFKSDGISREELKELLGIISDTVIKIEPSTEKTQQKKEYISAFLEEAEEAVEIAFERKGYE